MDALSHGSDRMYEKAWMGRDCRRNGCSGQRSGKRAAADRRAGELRLFLDDPAGCKKMEHAGEGEGGAAMGAPLPPRWRICQKATLPAHLPIIYLKFSFGFFNLLIFNGIGSII